MMKSFMDPGGELEDVFEAGALTVPVKPCIQTGFLLGKRLHCQHVQEVRKDHFSPWARRFFLSPWYERGGMHPADEKDVPVI